MGSCNQRPAVRKLETRSESFRICYMNAGHCATRWYTPTYRHGTGRPSIARRLTPSTQTFPTRLGIEPDPFRRIPADVLALAQFPVSRRHPPRDGVALTCRPEGHARGRASVCSGPRSVAEQSSWIMAFFETVFTPRREHSRRAQADAGARRPGALPAPVHPRPGDACESVTDRP